MKLYQNASRMIRTLFRSCYLSVHQILFGGWRGLTIESTMIGGGWCRRSFRLPTRAFSLSLGSRPSFDPAGFALQMTR